MSVLAAGHFCPQAFCLTSAELEDKIRDAKIIKGNIAVSISEHDANVQEFGVNVNDDYKKDDFKIDAVLIAKEVMNADPAIERVRVYFRDKGNPSLYCSVMVHISIVKTFASGAMKQSDLLKAFSIEGPFSSATAITSSAATTANTKIGVVSTTAINPSGTGGTTGNTGDSSEKSGRYGQFTENMNRADQMIKSLESKHINVSPYKSKYTDIENLIQNKNIKGSQDELERLLNSLDDQQKKLGSQKGATAAKTVATNASTSNIATRLAAYLLENQKESTKVYYTCVAECGGDMQAALRLKYGKFAPSNSFTLMSERFYIAEAILALRNAGIDVSRYEANFAELNNAADQRNVPKTQAIAEGFFKAFHLTEASCQNWWSISQKNRFGGSAGRFGKDGAGHEHHGYGHGHGGEYWRERMQRWQN